MTKSYAQWPTDDLRAALVQAADGEEEWARELLAAGADPNGVPLLMAIQCGELEIVRLFIAAGVDVDRDWAGTTPLLHAVSSGYPTIVQALINAGADVNKHDEQGTRPMMRVDKGVPRDAGEGRVEMRRMLIEGGAITTEGA